MDLQQFTEQLASYSTPVVVEFWAQWCGPCRQMAPALKQSAEKFDGQVALWKINADESPEVLRKFGVMGIPTMLGFRGGKQVSRRVGSQSQGGVDEFFAALLQENPVAAQNLPSWERGLRLLAGGALLVVGLLNGGQWVLMLLGGLVMFSAVYDRCPVVAAIRARLGI